MARRAHYDFAFRLFPTVAFSQPQELLLTMAAPDRAQACLKHWCEWLAEQYGGDIGFTADDFSVHRSRVSGFPCLVLEMPKPQMAPEAHFVACVLMASDFGEGAKNTECRYFTLEMTQVCGEDEAGTVLGGVNAKGTHLNFGGGPRADLELFLQAIEARLDHQQPKTSQVKLTF